MKAGASSESNSNNNPQYRHTPFSKFVGTALGAFGEQTLFHPIDTLAKKAMADKKPVFPWLRELVSQQGAFGAWQRLYGAFTLAYLKKAPLRIYKYGVQDEVAAKLKAKHGEWANAQFGEYGHVVLQSIAGGATGAFEPVLFQWIDTLQVRKQAIKEPISVASAQQLGITGLYRGTLVTGLGRNVPGAIGLFGGSAYANHVMGNQDHKSDAKNLLAKWFGAFLSLVASQPADVVKTTMQVEQIGFLSAMKHISWKQMFTNGLGPRLVMSGKVGAGFLFVEKGMELAKQWFGEEVKKPEQKVDVSGLLETKPAMLSQFKAPQSECQAADKMEPECQATDDLKELSEKMEKMRISNKKV